MAEEVLELTQDIECSRADKRSLTNNLTLAQQEVAMLCDDVINSQQSIQGLNQKVHAASISCCPFVVMTHSHTHCS